MSDLWTTIRGERHRVVFIEYDDDDMPFSVITEEHWDHSREPWFKPGKNQPTGIATAYFDFKWSKSRGILFWHMNGFGGGVRDILMSRFVNPDNGCRFWSAPHVRFTKWVGKDCHGHSDPASESDLAEMGYRRIADPLPLMRHWRGEPMLNPFEAADGDVGCVYCPKCDDHIPEETDHPCEHLSFCERCGEIVLLKGKGHVPLHDDGRRPYRHALVEY